LPLDHAICSFLSKNLGTIIHQKPQKGWLSPIMIQKQDRHIFKTPIAHENMSKPIVLVSAGPNG
jgi:hypothetical protein